MVGLHSPSFPLAPVLLVAISGCCLQTIRSRPHLFTGWCWFLGALTPVIALNDIVGADRFTYVPLIGLFVMAAGEVPRWFPTEKRARCMANLAVLAIIAGFAAANMFQLRHWRNTHALFGHALEINPRHYVAHGLLGDLLRGDRKPSEALSHYTELVRLLPEFVEGRVKLANALAQCGREAEAVAQYRKITFPSAEAAEAQFDLGAILAGKGRTLDLNIYRIVYRRCFKAWRNTNVTNKPQRPIRRRDLSSFSCLR